MLFLLFYEIIIIILTFQIYLYLIKFHFMVNDLLIKKYKSINTNFKQGYPDILNIEWDV